MALLSLFLSLVGVNTARSEQADWGLEIVANGAREERGAIIPDALNPDFFVVLTNRTDHDLKVWRQWCSWGYYALTFLVTKEGGSKFTLERSGGAWLWNQPDAAVVHPGKSFVLKGSVDKKGVGRFEGFPKGYRDGVVTIRACYKVLADEDSKEKSVWTGEAVSKPEMMYLAKPE